MGSKLTGAEAIRRLEQLTRKAQKSGKKGGQASAAALTPEERVKRAKAAIAARWKGKKTMPHDQTAVLARLVDSKPVELRIAPGGGGARRRAAIDALVSKGLIRIVEEKSDSVTVERPSV